MGKLDRRFAIAPMMDWTDRHCRFFHRLLTHRALIYTEMITTGALIHGDRARLLRHDAAEHPVALQLGGSDPVALAHCARIGADAGYDEINLNVGCPSDRVQEGRFGACLMAEPALVGDCVAAMKAAVALPVTVKCRLGIDDQDPEAALDELAGAVTAAGVDALIVHARKAWLKGLSPRENRDVPPLDYPLVYRLKQAMPRTPIVINGGIAGLEEAQRHLQHVDGVMLGRAAYHDPYSLARLEQALFETPLPDRDEMLERMRPYVEAHLRAGGLLNHVARHLLGLYLGMPGARAFRRHLSEQMHRRDADWRAVAGAVAAISAQRQAA